MRKYGGKLGARLVRSSTKKYNCHSYAFYSSSPHNTYWIDPADVSIYVRDGSYVSTSSNSSGVKWLSNNNHEHSAIVSGNKNAKGEILYYSKWGDGPLMEHTYYAQPWAIDNYTHYKR